MQRGKLIRGKGHQFIQCSFKLQPRSPVSVEVAQCADTPVNQYPGYTGKAGVSWCRACRVNQSGRFQSTIQQRTLFKVQYRHSTSLVTHFCLRMIRKSASHRSTSAPLDRRYIFRLRFSCGGRRRRWF